MSQHQANLLQACKTLGMILIRIACTTKLSFSHEYNYLRHVLDGVDCICPTNVRMPLVLKLQSKTRTKWKFAAQIAELTTQSSHYTCGFGSADLGEKMYRLMNPWLCYECKYCKKSLVLISWRNRWDTAPENRRQEGQEGTVIQFKYIFSSSTHCLFRYRAIQPTVIDCIFPFRHF